MLVRSLSAIAGAALLSLLAAAPAAAGGGTRPFGSLIEAESFDAAHGVRVILDPTASGGRAVSLSGGDSVRFDSVDFGATGQASGYAKWRSCAPGAGTVELRVDSPAATPFLTMTTVGGCAQWYQSSLRLGVATTPTGVHSFYLHATSTGACDFYRFDSLQMIQQTSPPIP